MSCNYNKNKAFIKKLEDFYVKYSKNVALNRAKFLKRLLTHNIVTGEAFKYSYDLKNDYYIRYVDMIQREKYIQSEAKKRGYIALFITFTLNSKYHRFKLNNTKEHYIYNKKYDNSLTINDGYIILKDTLAKITDELSKQRSNRDKIDKMYFRVIEKHKDFTPHMHTILFIHPDDLEDTLTVIKHKIKCTDEKYPTETKIQYNYDDRKNKDNEIGRVEVEKIRDIEATTSYLLKYVRKQFTEEPYMLDGWAKVNKIRLISSSKMPILRTVYRKINKLIDTDIKELNEKNKINNLTLIIENTKLIYFENGVEIVKHTPKNNPIFEAKVYKKEYTKEFIKTNYEYIYEKYKRDYNPLNNEKTYIHLLNLLSASDRKSFYSYFKSAYMEEDDENISDYLAKNNNDYKHLLEEVEEFMKYPIPTIKKYKKIENIIIYKNGLEVYNKSNYETVIRMYEEEEYQEVECGVYEYECSPLLSELVS